MKRLKRNELLPAGIILTGGGSLVKNIEEIAKYQLKLPAKVGPTDDSINLKYKVKNPSWYTALGLALVAIENPYTETSNNTNLKQLKKFFKSLFSQLLP